MADMKAFEKALAEVKTLTKRPSNEDFLFLYAHFKQVTEGDNNGKRPGMMDLVGRAKFDAWDKLKGLSKDGAMQKYVDKVAGLLKTHK